MIVAGLGFGDEAKGLTTSFLCSQKENPLVVRFNGGHQAGHTVVLNGKRHVFSSFGAGTLQGVPTYWSKFCTFSPSAFLVERKLLDKPVIFVNPDCPVTTPFDIEANRKLTNGHGTVGVGFGTTLAREEAFYKLHVRDLFYPEVLQEKIAMIARYYGHEVDHDTYMKYIIPFAKDCGEAIHHITLFGDEIISHYNPIFEGAQGILLDQDHGFFPHVTRSNTTSKNARKLLHNKKDEVFYVTRSYLTRHGNGPFPSGGRVDLVNNENETNESGGYQGVFRTGLLNPQLTNYALDVDSKFSRGKKNLVISCMDQYELDVPGFLSQLKYNFDNVYLSHGPSMNCIEKYTQKQYYTSDILN